ncbi:MAG: DNA glycosylase [Sphaerochaetaceae bacterium]|nr:DNA glycosylase [Sphaerochaetaceae bacterium]
MKEKDLSLKQTLDCGQAFRWNCIDEINQTWTGIASMQTLTVSQNNLKVIEKSPFWSHYFDLEQDYDSIRNELSKISPIMEKACQYSPGIRILNQDPWEILISFILSQYNNISRIKQMVNNLCKLTNPETLLFPSPKQILEINKEDLQSLKFGFRDKYVLDGAIKIDSGEVNLEEIKNMEIKDAEKELMKIKGIGKKVSSCILLFGFHRLESFPVDVWIKRAMDNWFEGKEGEQVFGPYAGIAQQYLFNYIRNLQDDATS